MFGNTIRPFQGDLTNQLGITSPVSWLRYGDTRTHPPKPYFSQIQDERDLASEDASSSYLVDDNGDEYEPYSLAWRYLGVFLDCGDEEEGNSQGNSVDNERELSSDEDANSGCARKVMWAAYHDPEYSGGSIGEYQYFNLATGLYDDSHCRTGRCAKMDCHDPDTHFELVGVFKETDGFYDWAEQLFKHEGYCLWDYDTYQIMSTYREYLPSGCKQLNYPDNDDNTVYMDILPEPLGTIDIGVYVDDKCTKPAKITIQQYIEMFYENKGDNEGKGPKIARAWAKAIKRWNKHMNVYKICQPCRAYSLAANNNNVHSEDRRHLENDGNGDDEQWGFDCYDAAGYTNCNQCYKFETKTNMEPANEEDLRSASKQGSILAIDVNGKRYGRGGFYKPWYLRIPLWSRLLIGIGAGLVILGFCTLAWKRFANSALLANFLEWLRNRFNQKNISSSFKPHYHIEDIAVVPNDKDDQYRKPLSYVYE